MVTSKLKALLFKSPLAGAGYIVLDLLQVELLVLFYGEVMDFKRDI